MFIIIIKYKIVISHAWNLSVRVAVSQNMLSVYRKWVQYNTMQHNKTELSRTRKFILQRSL